MKHAIVAAAIVAFVGVTSAQNAIDAEQISGRWGDNGRTLLDLKTARPGVVSGMVYIYEGLSRYEAAIKTGTFDPKTGLLRLAGETVRNDGTAMAYTIEAKLERDSLVANYVFGTRKGTQTLKKIPPPQ